MRGLKENYGIVFVLEREVWRGMWGEKEERKRGESRQGEIRWLEYRRRISV